MVRTARKRAAAGLAAVFLVLAPAPGTAGGEVEPAAFVERLLADVVNNLAAEGERRELRARFREMSGTYLAFDRITRFVTGDYWTRASAEQRAAFREAFRHLLRARFLPVLKKAGDVQFDLAGSRTVRDGLWQVGVYVRQAGPKAEVTRVGLRVLQTPEGLRVADVVTKGVSLGVTLREEYTSFLARHDGDMTALTARVRERARKLES